MVRNGYSIEKSLSLQALLSGIFYMAYVGLAMLWRPEPVLPSTMVDYTSFDIYQLLDKCRDTLIAMEPSHLKYNLDLSGYKHDDSPISIFWYDYLVDGVVNGSASCHFDTATNTMMVTRDLHHYQCLTDTSSDASIANSGFGHLCDNSFAHDNPKVNSSRNNSFAYSIPKANNSANISLAHTTLKLYASRNISSV